MFPAQLGEGASLAVPFHCFGGTYEETKRIVDLGGYISISGIVTFKIADELRALVHRVPVDRLLIETNAPFWAPAPHRGTCNESRLVRHVAQSIASIKNLTTEQIAIHIRRNILRFFRIKKQKLPEPPEDATSSS